MSEPGFMARRSSKPSAQICPGWSTNFFNELWLRVTREMGCVAQSAGPE